MRNLARTTLRAGFSTLLLWGLAVPAVQAEDVLTVEIRATEFSFEPAEIDVDKGETVRLRLVNAGSLSHNVHLEGAPVKTETVQSGASDTVQFTAEKGGTIQFFCNVPGHKQAGMTGQIAIE